jgi:hypothetical protein
LKFTGASIKVQVRGSGGMTTQVTVRQSIEGRKVQIYLSRDDAKFLLSGGTIQISDDGDENWEDNLEIRNVQEEPLRIVDVAISLQD